MQIARLEKFTLGSLLISDYLRALMIIFESMSETDFLKALTASDRVDSVKSSVAFLSHALLDRF